MEQTYYYYNLRDLYNVSKTAVVDSKLPIWSTIYTKIMTNQNNQFKMYANFDNSDMEQKLLQPLINRWANDNCYLLVTTQAPTQAIPSIIGAFTVTEANALLSSVWFKLDSILPKYKELYKRYNEMLTAIDNGLSNEATTTSTSRHNDTPNANNDYSAETFTSDITSNTSTSKQTNNKLDDYDAIRARIENLPQQIINEMKVFEIWI